MRALFAVVLLVGLPWLAHWLTSGADRHAACDAPDSPPAT